MTRSLIPELTEREFQRQVTDLAEMCGWKWAHFRPAQTSKGWRTPVSGPLGAGWPDLVLVREKDRRLIFAELKRDGAKPTVQQVAVHQTLAVMDWHQWPETQNIKWVLPRMEFQLWRPADFDAIAAALR